MEKIIEVNEEINICNENNNEVKVSTNEYNNIINNRLKMKNDKNINNNDIETNNNHKIENINIKNINNKSTEQIHKNFLKKKKIKKLKIKKGKSKSGINLSTTPPDSQSQKIKKQKDEIYKTKEPLFIQIIKPSESKLMYLYNFSSIESQKQREQDEINYKKIINITKEINKKHKKEIIILIRENENENNNCFLQDLYSIYSIGDCYYSLRKDYNFPLHIQSYIYISNYFNKSYDMVISENSYLTPGIKGGIKVNDLDINKNSKALKTIFSSNCSDNKLINDSNIKFIQNNQILNWSKLFF